MKTKEIITVFISTVIEAILTFLLTQVLSLKIWGFILAALINAVVLFLLYLWFSKKVKEHEEKDAILSNMSITTKEHLLEFGKLHKNLDLLGIKNCTEKLTDTPFMPKTCMKNVKKTLFFMGVAGSKWVNDPPVYAEFERMLRKVSAAQGEVRFLLLNPNGNGWKKLKNLRRDNLSDSSYNKYQILMKNYPCLKVRLYDPLPSFRLQFVDGTYIAVSRYKLSFLNMKKLIMGGTHLT